MCWAPAAPSLTRLVLPAWGLAPATSFNCDFRLHPHAEDAQACPSQPDISPGSGHRHRPVPLVALQGWLPGMLSSSGYRQPCFPPTKPALPTASPSLASSPTGPQIQALSSFICTSANSPINITTICPFPPPVHLTPGGVWTSSTPPTPHMGCSTQGYQRAPVNTSAGPAPFCSEPCNAPTLLRAKAQVLLQPTRPCGILPLSSPCPPLLSLTPTSASSLFLEHAITLPPQGFCICSSLSGCCAVPSDSCKAPSSPPCGFYSSITSSVGLPNHFN